MFLGRSLPLNVQALICSYLPRRAQSALFRAARPSPGLFVSTTVSLSSATPLFADPVQTSTIVRLAEEARLASASVFEDDDPEYEDVPLSRLDNPPVPRSPDDSLLSLLRAGQWSEAATLLHELRDVSQQFIPPRYDFATFALAAAERDIAAHSTERAWLEWWKLAPRMAMQAERIIKWIIEAPDNAVGAGAEHTSIDWQLLEDFAAVLSQQGHAQTVAARILPMFARYSSPEAFERIFRTALASIADLDGRYTPRGPYLDHRPAFGTSAEKALNDMVLRHGSPTVREEQVAHMRTWWTGRCERELKELVFARSKAVVSYLKLGRPDAAVDLVLGLPGLHHILLSTRIDLKKPTYLELLGTLAQYGRFEAFEQVYQSLLDGGRRLIRVHKPDVAMRWPFHVRSTGYRTDQPLWSAREAFTSFRYQTAVTSIEEGPTAAHEQAESIPVEEDDDPPGNRRSETILGLVEEDRFEESAAIVTQYLLLDSSLPSANALATWIDYARSLASRSTEAADVLAAIEEQACARLLQRTFWYNAEMLSSLRAERYHEVLRLYAQAFDVAALPPAAQYAIRSRTQDRIFSRRRTRPRLVPQAYTVAVLVQALVGVIEGEVVGLRRANAEDVGRLIEAIYDDLKDPSKTSMVAPKRAPAIATTDFDAPVPLVPHNAYTFIPFLLYRWRKCLPPLSVLSILSDMRQLGIRPEAPHYSIVLNSFAKLGDSPTVEARNPARRGSADLIYLLSIFEPTTFPLEQSIVQAASPAVVSFARSIAPPAAPLPVQTYSGIIAGLRLRSERATIVKVVKQLAETRTSDVQQWAREDARFREELRSLKGAIGPVQSK
ncbi:proteophosphoglycan 5 [Rhodotorula toruloides]|uniref:Proteophosphoglycan 5 n=1 Tax=Rhodotorula toruloides TaxID=5286 RepID=A0A511KMS4_RHOTO|nr:proteophosphoglycan 5 [Rhodotorula toruloides]